MFDVAVVGNGASAVFTLLQLARLAPAWRVAQIAGTEPGHGIAYSSASNLHLLNVPADRMGAPPEQPDHFWRWLEVNGRCGTCQSTDFVPRRWYGDYLQSIHESFDPAPHRYRQRLEAMDRADDDCWRLRLSDGTAVEARRLVLGLGLPSLEAPWPARPGIERDGWRWWQNLPSDWRPPAADQQIVLVGSGLTAIDLALGLRERGFRGHIRAISPSGRWSEPHAATAAVSAEVRASLLADLRSVSTACGVLAVLRRYCAEHPWRAVIDALRADSNDIWGALPIAQRRRLLDHALSLWNRHRHRVPPASLAAIGEDAALTIERGRVLAGPEGEMAVCRGHRSVTRGEPLSSALVINCAGAALGNRPRWNVVHGLALRSGFVRANEIESGLVSARPQDLELVGSCRFGEHIEATAVPELRMQARDLILRWCRDDPHAAS